MEVSVIVCDYAQVNNNKLYIVGGAGNLLPTASAEAPHPISGWAAILITLPWQAHNQMHKISISLVDADDRKVPLGEPLPGAAVSPGDAGSVIGQFNAGRSAIMQPGDETLMPLAIPLNVSVPAPGIYRVIVEIDGTPLATARFRVAHFPQLGVQL